MDKDMMEMMGFGGFGKKKVEKASAIPQRLQSTKREEENNKIEVSCKLVCQNSYDLTLDIPLSLQLKMKETYRKSHRKSHILNDLH